MPIDWTRDQFKDSLLQNLKEDHKKILLLSFGAATHAIIGVKRPAKGSPERGNDTAIRGWLKANSWDAGITTAIVNHSIAILTAPWPQLPSETIFGLVEDAEGDSLMIKPLIVGGTEEAPVYSVGTPVPITQDNIKEVIATLIKLLASDANGGE